MHTSLALTDDPLWWLCIQVVANHEHSVIDFQRRIRGIGRTPLRPLGQLAISCSKHTIYNRRTCPGSS